MLGYTQVSWDNDSGQETQPFSSYKFWASLLDIEKAAAMLLGYNRRSWDNKLGLITQPASFDKRWTELTSCSTSESIHLIRMDGKNDDP